jgi:hypothetical protein
MLSPMFGDGPSLPATIAKYNFIGVDYKVVPLICFFIFFSLSSMRN